jgi:hypothetical protein
MVYVEGKTGLLILVNAIHGKRQVGIAIGIKSKNSRWAFLVPNPVRMATSREESRSTSVLAADDSVGISSFVWLSS